jgi:DNA-binding XRE family transcriptional regulator
MNPAKFETVRIEKKMSKVDLCRYAKISPQTYDNIINGKTLPRVEIVEKLCRILKMNPAALWVDDMSFVSEPVPEGYKKICQDCDEKDMKIRDLHNSIRNLNKCLDDCLAEKKSRVPIPGKVVK